MPQKITISRLASLLNLKTIDSLEIHIDEPGMFHELFKLTSIKSLTISSGEEITDLSPLSSLTQLTDLNRSCCDKFSDLTSLSGLAQISPFFNDSLRQYDQLYRRLAQ